MQQAAFSQLVYRPPSGRGSQQQTQSGTMRGCGQTQTVEKLKILAPADHVGLTRAKNPTFLFWVSDSKDLSMRISLTQPYREETVWLTQVKPPPTGIFSVTLPETVSLQLEEIYILTAEIPCASDSSNFVRVVIKRVNFNSEELAINQYPKSSLEEFWYDLIWWSYQYSPSDFQHLLKQVNIRLN
jgi:hypothetical protein